MLHINDFVNNEIHQFSENSFMSTLIFIRWFNNFKMLVYRIRRHFNRWHTSPFLDNKIPIGIRYAVYIFFISEKNRNSDIYWSHMSANKKFQKIVWNLITAFCVLFRAEFKNAIRFFLSRQVHCLLHYYLADPIARDRLKYYSKNVEEM